jgi:hypothetical protein
MRDPDNPLATPSLALDFTAADHFPKGRRMQLQRRSKVRNPVHALADIRWRRNRCIAHRE